jgi:hypothetical protein
MTGNTDPVLFAPAGQVNQTVNSNSNSGFDSPATNGAGGQPAVVAYSIPPAFWMILFLVGGYMGLRWVMED